MHGASAAARHIATFGWWLVLVFCAATVVVWLVLAYIGFRNRQGSFAAHAEASTDEGKGWIAIAGFCVPAAVFIAFFFLMFLPMDAMPMHQHPEHRADIRVTGQQWWFDAEYLGDTPDLAVHVPTELHIPVGKAVDIELVSRDVIHSFWVPKLQGKVDLVPGHPNRIRIQADVPGIYEGECAEFCGVQHAHMRIAIQAQPPDMYAAWLQDQRRPAYDAPDESAVVARGRDVFMSAPCTGCHTVRGTPAQGRIGPDLTHVGGRASIAGGSLPNDTAHLTAWIVDAQSLKPGAQMPTMRTLSGQDLRALVAWLQSLR
jgi:cytochrome c oxidase subunit 2